MDYLIIRLLEVVDAVIDTVAEKAIVKVIVKVIDTAVKVIDAVTAIRRDAAAV